MDNKFPLVNRIDSIHQVEAQDWNACAGPEHPFLWHQFFACMEDSGTACPETGWQPCHLLFRREGKIGGVSPLFVKFHSEGEFGFSITAGPRPMNGPAAPTTRNCSRRYPIPRCRARAFWSIPTIPIASGAPISAPGPGVAGSRPARILTAHHLLHARGIRGRQQIALATSPGPSVSL